MSSNQSITTDPKDNPEINLNSDKTKSSSSSNKASSATTSDIPEFGWSKYAERINGRFAMIGFIAILLIEALSRDSFLKWSGIFQ